MLPPERRPPAIEMTRIEAGTVVPVRTNQYISSDRADGRIFTGTTSDDVLGSNGGLAIPRGSDVELIVRSASDGDLILDLESVMVDGRRYAVDASVNRIDAGQKDGVGANQRTGKFVGGGAILGAIIGAAAGGGKGAAIGAGVGAAAGATSEMATRGREVRVPAETMLTFRIDRPLNVNVADDGRTDQGFHYHRDEQ
jgi:outer membrane lipoprotein SlyB